MNSLLKFTLALFVLFFSISSASSQSCSGIVNSYPYAESFETPGAVWDQWASAAVPWFFNVGGTPTQNTGPTGASDGLGYVYVEATNNLGAGVLLSPCFDLTPLTDPQLTFDFHLWGQDAFRFLVQASTDGGNTWSTILLSAINDQGPNWNSEAISLSQFTNETNLRLRIIGVVNDTGGNDEGDVAFDNVKIDEAPPCFDISVSYNNVSCNGSNDGDATLLVYPANTQGLSILWSTGDTTNAISNLSPGNYSVEVTDNNLCTKTKNFSISDASEISAELYITPNSANGVADGRIHSVVSGGTPPYTYAWANGSTGATNFNVSNGYEELNITDANGCTAQFPTFLPVSELCSGVYGGWPYHLNFEGGLGRFKQGTDDNRNWKRYSGSTPTSNTGPTSAVQGSKYRYIESSGNGGPFKTAVMVSKRCFDISNLTNPELYFQYHMYGAEMGQLFVQTSTDGGYVWRENLWEVEGDQGNMWKEAFIDLSDVSSSTLMIRIVGRTGSGSLSDIAIDDLFIRSASSSLVAPVTDIMDSREESHNLETATVSRVFPNPITDIFTVESASEIKTIRVMDFQGQIVKTIQASGNNAKIDINALSKGMYLLQVVDATGEIEMHKILKI